MAKYKYGDRVRLNGYSGKVVSVFPDANGDYICKVEFDDGTKAEIPEYNLRPALNVSFKNVKPPSGAYKTVKLTTPIKHININITISKDGIEFKDYCPVCKNPYHTIPHPIHGAKEMWSDCLTCGKTKEQIEEEKCKPISKEINDDYDDYDDFGFYS